MRCQTQAEVGRTLRQMRELQGLSQRQLALRAGTSQDAISRIERGAEAPTLERFAQLMLVLGQRFTIVVEPMAGLVEGEELSVAGELTHSERLREGIAWNRTASQMAIAGERARSAGHPATRRSAR